jgi:trichothecene 3-O-acetyltransferase
MGLGRFVKSTVNAAPFLAGYVHPSPEEDNAIGRVEIRFTREDVDTFPTIQIREYNDEEMPWTYDDLSNRGLPPSAIRPDLVSALPENTDDGRAPVFRVQANLLDGGLIVSIYLHHCVTDGFGLGLLVSGSILNNAHIRERTNGNPNSLMTNGRGDCSAGGEDELDAIAYIETRSRGKLSRSKGYDTQREYSDNTPVHGDTAGRTAASPGRGCVFVIPHVKMDDFKSLIMKSLPKDDNDVTPFITDHDVLQALLWHHLTQARKHSVNPAKVNSSTLLIPVNIRGRMIPPLPSSYFGSAVDFASVRQTIVHLSTSTPSSYAMTALAIRRSVTAVQDPYVRATINLSNTPYIDVRDLLAANINRATGADMYITSWHALELYEKGDLGMGLGMPDWVRKPWSRDPGACIILPQDPRKKVLEVVVQMAAADMERLLRDDVFMEFVERTIE